MHQLKRRHVLRTGALLAAATIVPALGACTVGGVGQPTATTSGPPTTVPTTTATGAGAMPTAPTTSAAATGARTTAATPATASVTASRSTGATPGTPLDWQRVDAALGRAGALQPGEVYRFGFPRTDLQVTARGVPLKAGFALGSHVEFLQVGADRAMFMGDLVLTEDEVNPVLAQLQQGGIDLAALHNHLLGETPRVMYLHIMGHADPVPTAAAIRAALAASKTPLAAPTAGQAEQVDLDTTMLDGALGYRGKANGAIYQYGIPRAETIRDMGVELPPAIGVATAINFQPTGGGKAAITGDFVLLGGEVAAVSRALRAAGIDVTALHSHGLSDEPRLFYMHFWAVDDAAKLARGLRAALATTNSVKPQ